MSTEKLNKQGVRILLVLLLLGLFSLTLAQPAHAAEFRRGNTAVIAETERIDDDLFITGESVTINGTVTGNLSVAGANITINGTVEGSLFAAGQNITVNGTVNGTLFGSGYSLTLGPEAVIDGNLFFSGFSLTTAQGSRVGHSLFGRGYQLLLNGEVSEDVNVGAAALELTGVVGGDVRGHVSSVEINSPIFWLPTFGQVSPVPPGLRIDDSAGVAGAVAVDTITDVNEAAAPFYSLANERTRWVIGELVALLLVGCLLLWLRPDWLRRTGTAVQERSLYSLHVGLLANGAAFFLVPLLLGLIILLAVVAGWLSMGQLAIPVLGLGLTGLGFATAAFVFLVGMVSKIIVAYLGGRLLGQRPLPKERPGMDFAALFVGVVILMLLRALPFGIGFLIGLVVSLLGTGAFFLELRRTPRTQLVAEKPIRERPQESLAS
jgi:cytoskeletal protein CcmA (bactofilin family)